MENQNKQMLSNIATLNLFGKVVVLINSNDKSLSFIDILETLKNKDIDVNVLEVIDDGLNLLNKSIWQDFSRVFIAITSEHKLSFGHIQGLLDILGLEYTGSGMLAAALAGDIIKSKKIWQMMGIATTPFVRWKINIDWESIVSLIGFPLAIKSIYLNDKRVFKVLHMDQLEEVFKDFKNLNDVIIEPWITGDEYIVYIIDEQALLPLKITNCLKMEAVFNAKDHKENGEFKNISSMQKLAIDAFMALGCSGFAAVNILKDLNGDCWVLSINTAPPLARDSNFAIAAYNSGIKFEVLVERILVNTFIKKAYQRAALSDSFY